MLEDSSALSTSSIPRILQLCIEVAKTCLNHMCTTLSAYAFNGERPTCWDVKLLRGTLEVCLEIHRVMATITCRLLFDAESGA